MGTRSQDVPFRRPRNERPACRRDAAALTTCRKMVIEPRRYLRETLTKILAGEKDLRALLPETYACKTSEQAGVSAKAAA
jgi:hypothetical protein